jgi:hypothetical protein
MEIKDLVKTKSLEKKKGFRRFQKISDISRDLENLKAIRKTFEDFKQSKIMKM